MNGVLDHRRERLRPGDEIEIAHHRFTFEAIDAGAVTVMANAKRITEAANVGAVLRVTVSGGGPVGLAFALLLADLMGPKVAIRIYDGRWKRDGRKVVWKGHDEGNVRRMQVVTIQSRQFLKLPQEMQDHLFTPGNFTEMWPSGPDSVDGVGPRNIRIAYIEDQLLELANSKRGQIELIPEPVRRRVGRPARSSSSTCWRSARAAGRARSPTSSRKFGAADFSLYGLDGEQLSDMVLGLRVKSLLPDPMAVLLTVSQNRFLLNSLNGEGFLNMRLTDQEAKEAVGIDPVRQTFSGCIQSEPCLLELEPARRVLCGTHHTLFLPALLRGSAFWSRVAGGAATVRRPAGEPDRGDRLPAQHGAAAAVHRPAASRPPRRRQARSGSCSATRPTRSTSGRAAA